MALVTKIVSPAHDRARVRETWNRRAPQDVVAGRRTPCVGEVLLVADPGRFAAAERGPVAGASCRRPEWRRRAAGGSDDAARRDQRCRAGSQPPAAIQDHPALLAVVGDQVETNLRGLDRQAITRGAGAFLRTALILQRDLAACDLCRCPTSVATPGLPRARTIRRRQIAAGSRAWKARRWAVAVVRVAP